MRIAPIVLGFFAVLAAASGCAAPGSVDGVFHSADFSLRSDDPLARASGSDGDVLVVLSENDSETLRTVSVSLPHTASMQRGVPLEVGTGELADDGSYGDKPSVEVTAGKLVKEDRGDGVDVISSEDPDRAHSTGGTVTLDDAAASQAGADVSGSFRVDLDDGGFLEGVFTARMTD